MIDREAYILAIDKLTLPMINYHQVVNCGLSTVNFFGLAMGLFMMSASLMGWTDYESPSLSSALMFGGICECLIGFYDWYEERAMLSFLDLIYDILHMVFFYTPDLGKYSIWVPNEYHTYMQEVFYCLWFAFLLFVIVSAKDRGCIHIIYLFLLALGTVFLII